MNTSHKNIDILEGKVSEILQSNWHPVIILLDNDI